MGGAYVWQNMGRVHTLRSQLHVYAQYMFDVCRRNITIYYVILCRFICTPQADCSIDTLQSTAHDSVLANSWMISLWTLSMAWPPWSRRFRTSLAQAPPERPKRLHEKGRLLVAPLSSVRCVHLCFLERRQEFIIWIYLLRGFFSMVAGRRLHTWHELWSKFAA